MSGQRSLVDRVQQGLGRAALRIGVEHDAYRPRAATNPLASANRLVRLYVAFDVPGGGFRRAPSYGEVFWRGIFDAAYTLPGDYIQGPSGVYFIALQPPLLPVMCVQTNRVISLSRPAAQTRAGVNSYGGVVRATAAPILRGWPTSIMAVGARPGHDDLGLPGDGGAGMFAALLPKLPVAVEAPLMADLVTDDLGWTYVVSAAEQTEGGWRLTMRQVSS